MLGSILASYYICVPPLVCRVILLLVLIHYACYHGRTRNLLFIALSGGSPVWCAFIVVCCLISSVGDPLWMMMP